MSRHFREDPNKKRSLDYTTATTATSTSRYNNNSNYHCNSSSNKLNKKNNDTFGRKRRNNEATSNADVHQQQSFQSSRGGVKTGPQKSRNGWILFVTGIHEEAQEDDLIDLFSDFGKVLTFTINTDRRTGFAKGYALVEFQHQTEAQDAINSLHGKKYLDKALGVDWAFVKPAFSQ